jgi:hypothetical protein
MMANMAKHMLLTPSSTSCTIEGPLHCYGHTSDSYGTACPQTQIEALGLVLAHAAFTMATNVGYSAVFTASRRHH